MILKDLKIFSQNIQKNNFLINIILEVNQNFDIIFIQEPLWMTIRTIPSPENCKDVSLVGIPNHPNWLTFARELCSTIDSPRVIIYINVRLSSFWFSLRKDVINYRVILLASFFSDNNIFWIMNVYSDSSHSTLKYLMDTDVMECFGHQHFSFLLSIFLDFIFLFFWISFSFLFSDNEESCDIAVTWHVTWCDIIGLEGGRRIWKIMSGYMYTTWWPWGEHEEGAWT